MNYKVHAHLISFFALAQALFQEIIEGGPNYGRGGGVASTDELINMADTASLLGKIALFDAPNAEAYAEMNESLTSLVKRADGAIHGDSLAPDGMQFANCYPYFECIGMIGALEADAMLFASKLEDAEDDFTTERRMTGTAFSLLLRYGSSQALLGLSLLVAATVIAIKSGRTNPGDVSYPPLTDRVQYINGYVQANSLKAVVYGMAHAIAARV